MQSWVNPFLFSVLIVTIPFSMILRILTQLPKPHGLCHRRWPGAINLILIGVLSAYVTIFIRNAYYVRGSSPAVMLAQFMIAAVAYAFCLVLILRQFSGIYPEYIVTTGSAGLGIRKIAYRNVEKLDEVRRGYGETRLRIQTIQGNGVFFTVPSKLLSQLQDLIRSAQPPE